MLSNGAPLALQARVTLPLTDSRSEDPLLGQVLAGLYRLERLIARGGMGAVYEAQHLRLGSRVAVKVLLSPFGSDSALEARFEREVAIVKQLDHPHVVRIEDAGRGDDMPFFVMEYLEGETLGQRLRRDGALPMSEAIRIASDVCGTLAQVHAHGFVHCDMKPANVFLQHVEGEPDFVKLLDFGVSIQVASQPSTARETVVAGTPSYMAPEQARGDCDLDHRVDQFAVAAMTYEMLTGRRALSNEDADGSGLQSRHVTPLSELVPWVPAAFDSALESALSTDREQRHVSILSFAAALGNAANFAGIGYEKAWKGSSRASSRYHVACPQQELIEGSRVGTASGPPTQVDGPRYQQSQGGERIDPLVRAQELLLALRDCYVAGMYYQAAEHAEELLDMALHEASASTLRAIASGMPLIDRVFAAMVGPLDGVVAIAVDASALQRHLSPRAAGVLARIESPMTVAEVLTSCVLPTRDCVRVLASLLRSGALVRTSRPA